MVMPWGDPISKGPLRALVVVVDPNYSCLYFFFPLI